MSANPKSLYRVVRALPRALPEHVFRQGVRVRGTARAKDVRIQISSSWEVTSSKTRPYDYDGD